MTDDKSSDVIGENAGSVDPAPAAESRSGRSRRHIRAFLWTASTAAAAIVTLAATGLAASTWSYGTGLLTRFSEYPELKAQVIAIRGENDKLSEQLAELKSNPKSAQGLVTAYIPLHLVDRDECYKIIRNWPKISDFTRSGFNSDLRLFEISEGNSKAQVRCVGAKYADTSFIVIAATRDNKEFLANLHKDMEGDFYKYSEIETLTHPRDRYWTYHGPYIEAIVLNVETPLEVYREWSERFVLPDSILQAMKERGIKQDCYEVRSEYFCNFRFPKGSITFMMSSMSEPVKVSSTEKDTLDDKDIVAYEVNVAIAAMNYGKDDIFSSSHYYMANDFKDMLTQSGILSKEYPIQPLLRNWN